MSLLQSPRRSSSDALESSPDLHVGLDRELDLSSERPSTVAVGTGRGPGVMVATIVASSLALAGIIMLARGEPSEASADPSPPAPLPEVLASPVEPSPAPESGPSVPAAEPISAPSRVAAREVTPTAAIEPPHPVESPVSSEITPAAIAPAALGPAAIASPPRGPAPGSEPSLPPSPAGDDARPLPAPVFDAPVPEPTPTPEPEPTNSLPGVEEPSILAPDDEPADDEPAEESHLPSSTNAPDAREAIDALLDDEPGHDGARARDTSTV
ncbi:hypothetical protein [Paraliomyxa miuraensis]|uniref:hypothetical protein n=1 Tax=Paraliomyxa miuraensis TaxID=376150 RepID=UPI00225574AB|nr:hypothetical protein [Paraliomyxa miuraensis]MCX4242740.1 hypothetical protein [Paraliomyxa miuraensis]